MNIKELKLKKIEELNVLLKDLKKESFNLRFQKIYGQITDFSKMKKVRVNIARVKTIINQKGVGKGNA